MPSILILTPQLPYPPEQGTSLRNYNILRGLAKSHDLTLLSFRELGQDEDIPNELLRLANVFTVSVPVRSMAKRIYRLIVNRKPDMAHRLFASAFIGQLRKLLSDRKNSGNPVDIVQVEGLELAWTIPSIRQTSPTSKIVFDCHNAETDLQRRALLTDLPEPNRWPAVVYSLVQVGRLRSYERWACEAADSVVAVSQPDKLKLQKLAPGLEVTVLPNCVDVSEIEITPIGDILGFDIVFSGKMDYRPNVDAAIWFAKNVWPLIQRKRPETTWGIIGKLPHRRLNWIRNLDKVTVTGWVPDVYPYLKSSKVYVMPFRVGSGTRLKLLEAMSAGIPIVSTSVGAEGYSVKNNREILLADKPKQLARAISSLLLKPETRSQLSAAGKAFAHDYDWRNIIPKFDDIYSHLL